MNIRATVTVSDHISLLTLTGMLADPSLLTELFDDIAARGVNIDMIARSPSAADLTDVSFTFGDADFAAALEAVMALREHHPGVQSAVSGGNCKISVYSDDMRRTPGVAAGVFRLVAETGADLRIITTSEVDVSVLVSAASRDNLVDAVRQKFEQ